MVAHVFPEYFRGGISGAVAGVIARGEGGEELAGLRACFSIAAHEVESAYEHIRPEMGDKIEDAAVGAAADEDAFAVLLDEQVLLMPEIIGRPLAINDSAHACPCSGVTAGYAGGLIQGDAGGKLLHGMLRGAEPRA